MITFEPKYKIGQKIYHITPESQQGFIKDISYLVSSRQIEYLIAIDFSTEVWASERELSEDKIII